MPKDYGPRQCAGKTQYTERWRAERAAQRFERQRANALRTYRCQLCTFWHLTKDHLGATARCGTCLAGFEPEGPDDWACAACKQKALTPGPGDPKLQP